MISCFHEIIMLDSWGNFCLRIPFTNKKSRKESGMASMDEQILRATKEIVVKFIETGRLSPTGFHEMFKTIHQTIESTVRGRASTGDEGGERGQ